MFSGGWESNLLLPFKVLVMAKFSRFRGKYIFSPIFVVQSGTNNAFLCVLNVNVHRAVDKYSICRLAQKIKSGATV